MQLRRGKEKGTITVLEGKLEVLLYIGAEPNVAGQGGLTPQICFAWIGHKDSTSPR